MKTFMLRVYLLAVFGGLTEGTSATCLREGTKFMVLVTPPDTIIAVAGAPNTIVDSYELLSGKEEQHVINDSMVTYFEPVYNDTQVEPLWKKMRFILIRTSSHVNTFVHLSGGSGYTAVRSKHHVPYTYTIASFKPDINCETFVAVVSYNNNVTVNGTVRILNSNQAELEPGGYMLSDGESFGGDIQDKWDFLLMNSEGDLTGTHIEANKPIAVFAGSRCCEDTFASACESYRYAIHQVAPAKLHKRSQYLLHLFTPHHAYLRAVWNNGTSTTVDDSLDVFYCGSEKCQVIQNLILDGSQRVLLQTMLNQILRKKFLIVAFPGFNTSLYILIQHFSYKKLRSLKISNISVVEFERQLNDEPIPFAILRVSVEPGVHIVTCEECAFSLYAFGFGLDLAYSFSGGCIGYLKEDELTTAATTSSVTVTDPDDFNHTTEKYTAVTTQAEDNTMITTPSEDSITVTTPSEDNVTITTPSEENTMVTMPSENNIMVTASSEDNTTITMPSEDNTTVTTPSENNIMVTTPSEDDTTVANNDHNIMSDTTSDTTKDQMAETDFPSTTQNEINFSPVKSPNPVSKFCPYKNGEVCACSKQKHVNFQQTQLDTSGSLVTEPFLDRNTVGAKRRRKMSISDNRPSSKALGMVSVVVMCIPFGFVLLMDSQRLIVQMIPRCLRR